MKTLVLSMISIAATVAAMTACTSESDGIDEAQQLAIKLNAGVVQTKAVIESDASKHPTKEITPVYFYRDDETKGVIPTWTSSTNFNGKIGTDGTITGFTQYYASDGKETHIAGLYLGENITPAPAVTNKSVSFTIDGDQDILFAPTINVGSRNEPANSNVLAFEHKLTQFKFVAKTGTNIGAINGINVNIKNYNTTSTISLVDGTFGTWATPISAKNITLVALANGGASTPSDGIMLEPGLKSITLEVTASDYLTAAQSLTINGTDGTTSDSFEAGKSYTITITFKGKEVTASATISPWEEGTAPDSGEIE